MVLQMVDAFFENWDMCTWVQVVLIIFAFSCKLGCKTSIYKFLAHVYEYERNINSFKAMKEAIQLPDSL